MATYQPMDVEQTRFSPLLPMVPVRAVDSPLCAAVGVVVSVVLLVVVGACIGIILLLPSSVQNDPTPRDTPDDTEKGADEKEEPLYSQADIFFAAVDKLERTQTHSPSLDDTHRQDIMKDVQEFLSDRPDPTKDADPLSTRQSYLELWRAINKDKE